MSCPFCGLPGIGSGPLGHFHCDKMHTWVSFIRIDNPTPEEMAAADKAPPTCPVCKGTNIHITERGGSLVSYECDYLPCLHRWVVRLGLPEAAKEMLDIAFKKHEGPYRVDIKTKLPEFIFKKLLPEEPSLRDMAEAIKDEDDRVEGSLCPLCKDPGSNVGESDGSPCWYCEYCDKYWWTDLPLKGAPYYKGEPCPRCRGTNTLGRHCRDIVCGHVWAKEDLPEPCCPVGKVTGRQCSYGLGCNLPVEDVALDRFKGWIKTLCPQCGEKGIEKGIAYEEKGNQQCWRCDGCDRYWWTPSPKNSLACPACGEERELQVSGHGILDHYTCKKCLCGWNKSNLPDPTPFGERQAPRGQSTPGSTEEGAGGDGPASSLPWEPDELNKHDLHRFDCPRCHNFACHWIRPWQDDVGGCGHMYVCRVCGDLKPTVV